MKPHVFIGSSSESLDIAYAIQENIEKDSETTVWSQNIFELSSYTLDSLLESLGQYDFGIFVLGQDDVVRMRGSEHPTARDNVIFELGLFIGRLGKHRSFIVTPRGIKNFHLPTDLLGLGMATYEQDRQDGNLMAALGPACHRIVKMTRKLGTVERAPSIDESREPKIHEKGRLPLDYQIQFLQSASSEIVVIGSSLRTFVGYFDQRPSYEFKDPILDLLRRGVNIRLVLLDPKDDISRSYAESRNDLKLIVQTAETLERLERLAQEIESCGVAGKLDVLTYAREPFGFIMLVDPELSKGSAIFFHYLPSTKRADSPYFEVYKEASPSFFDTYHSIAREILGSATVQFVSGVSEPRNT